jgi:hypothetical protein
MPKNVVLCCDGTANEFAQDRTNVVKLYFTLACDSTRQVAYYHPGLGTMEPPGALTKATRIATRVAGMAFGYGLEADIRSLNRSDPDAFNNELACPRLPPSIGHIVDVSKSAKLTRRRHFTMMKRVGGIRAAFLRRQTQQYRFFASRRERVMAHFMACVECANLLN